MRRYELQLWEPDKGGWRTVLTAATPGDLDRTARTLRWQTQKPVRLVGPGGIVPVPAEEEGEPASRG